MSEPKKISIITLTLGTKETYYTKEKVTLDLLKKFLNKVEPVLDVRICRDQSSEWLYVEGQIWAEKQDGWSLIPCYENTLNWNTVEELIL